MKRVFCLILTVALTLLLFTACTDDKIDEGTKEPANDRETTVADITAVQVTEPATEAIVGDTTAPSTDEVQAPADTTSAPNTDGGDDTPVTTNEPSGFETNEDGSIDLPAISFGN